MKLKDIISIKPIYFIPRDNFVDEVLIPCLKIANTFNCMLGFFSSESFREIAPGLALFLKSKKNKMRLLISPFISLKDQKAFEAGVSTQSEILERKLLELFEEAYLSESALVKHTLDCLAYLIATGQLEIKIILITNALFHPKVWILNDGNETVIAHGSANMTGRALTANYEHITVESSWGDTSQKGKIDRFMQEFKTLWNEDRSDVIVVNLPNAIRQRLLKDYMPSLPPTYYDFLKAWEKDYDNDFVSYVCENPTNIYSVNDSPHFHIPDWLRYKEGDYAHQGKAVDAFLVNDGNGVLEMATGSGKTITAMVAAYHIYQKASKLLIIIAVPYVPLIHQWEEETLRFGLKPVLPNRENGRIAKFQKIEHVLRNLQSGLSNIDCLIITHDLLCDDRFHKVFKNHKIDILLIADEVHNLGRQEFVNNPPTFPKYKLGLSATPIRQYDEEGTDALFEYFGQVVFRFGLEEAIGNCLVPYEYFVHPINLTDQELDEWRDLNEQLKKNFWFKSNDIDEKASDYVNSLLRRRRLILENASGKIEKLKQLLQNTNINDFHHNLIYATDKDPKQLIQVNNLLRNSGIRYHQITAAETVDPNLVSQIFERFKNRELQVLTAKRVLDEGVNIPEITTAYILASTTVERQWTQRRGRLLRKCSAIKKEYSIIHDFLVLPPESEVIDQDARKIVKSELKRILEFAKLASNAATFDGALEVIRPIYSRYFAGERG